MKLVGVCACCSGIAHTYMAKEGLLKAAEELGFDLKLETQGTIGVENQLTPEDVKAADAVILAIDVHIEGRDRFAEKRVMEIPTGIAIKAPKQVLLKVQEELQKVSQ